MTPLEGLEALLPGCEMLDGGCDDPESCARAARGADAAVVVVGFTHDDEGEYIDDIGLGGLKMGGDRKRSLGLRPRDIEIVRAVCAANSKTAVVLAGGSMIMVEEWKSAAPAIVMAYYPGMRGGTAIAQTLFGDNNPGGKLPFAIPARESDLPAVDWDADRIEYSYYNGYRKLQKEGAPQSFPYGFGLSYTSFALSDPVFEASPDGVEASCTASRGGRRYAAPSGSSSATIRIPGAGCWIGWSTTPGSARAAPGRTASAAPSRSESAVDPPVGPSAALTRMAERAGACYH